MRFGLTLNRRRNGRFCEYVVCKDGFQMSVQASSGHYCEPREDNAPLYIAVEVGFPSEREELLMQFVEDADHPTETVYGHVPDKLIDEIIEKHGGEVQ